MCLIPDIGCDFFLFCPEKLGQSFINFIDLFEELGFELLIKHFFSGAQTFKIVMPIYHYEITLFIPVNIFLI